MARFITKPNFGHFSVIDTINNKMIVGYPKKIHAEITAKGLNKIKTETSLQKKIKLLKTMKGYGYFINKESK